MAANTTPSTEHQHTVALADVPPPGRGGNAGRGLDSDAWGCMYTHKNYKKMMAKDEHDHKS